MTNIPLRAYIREIEDSIEDGQLDQAVAHCRHILKTFPKHVDSYRLLGKIYLEAQKYSNAADIFERVLSSIPDDFVSHIGMSIIREDDGNLETAIWHMERAFESQPYNAGIQAEIKRLHGKRDGMEPSKARLTQGALARMYAKGGHYKQAIAEFRNILAKDPNRPDLSVALANAYFLNGDEFDAIQTCSTILRKLPYCMDANRLLASLLEGTERQEERQKCLQRLHALDPYEALVSDSNPTAEQVSDQAVGIERLIWDGTSSLSDSDEAEWSPSLESGLDKTEPSEEGVPDWLAETSEEAPASENLEDFLSPEADSDEEEIPDWMKDAGWEASSGEFDEQDASLLFDETEAEITTDAVEAEIPDWIQSMAPDSEARGDAAATPDQLPDEDDAADILEDLFPEFEEEAIPDWFKEETESSADQFELEDDKNLEWLSDLQEEEPVDNATIQSDDDEFESEDLPGWLQGVQEENSTGPGIFEPVDDPEQIEYTSGGITDFLDGLKTDGDPEGPQDPNHEPGEELPEWMFEKDDGQTAEVPLPEAQLDADPVTQSEDTDADIPDWLQDTIQEAPISLSESAETLDGIEVSDLDDTAHPQDPADGDEIPEWLKESDVGDATPAAEASHPQSDDIPDWLKTSQGEGIAEPSEGIAEPTPPQEASQPSSETVPDDIPEWLQGLEEVTDKSIEKQVEAQEERDIPEWLDNLAGKELQEEAAAKPPQPIEEIKEAASQTLEVDDEKEIQIPSQEGLELEPQDKPLEESQAESEIEFPEWLEASEGQEQATVDGSPEKEVDFPEWLAEPKAAIEGAAEGEADEAVEHDEAVPDFEDADSAMAWLEGLAAKQGVSEEELITSPDDRPEEPPEWAATEIQQPEAASVGQEDEPDGEAETPSEVEITEGELIPETEEPVWLADIEADETDIAIPEPSTPTDPEDEPAAELDATELAAEDTEIPEWLLESEAPSESAKPEEAPDDDQDQVPDWLQDTAIATPEAEIPATEAESDPAPSQEFDDADAAMAWLEGLAAKQGVSEEELLSSPDDRLEDLPASLADTPEDEEAIAEPLPSPREAETSMPEDSDAEATTEDYPEWLQDPAFASPGTIDVEPIESENESQPVEATPEWSLDDLPGESELEPDAAETGESDMWLKLDEEDGEFEIDDEGVPDWLQEMRSEKLDVKTDISEDASEIDDAPKGDAPQGMDIVPDWLKAEVEKVDTDELPIPDDATWVREFGKDVPKFEVEQPQRTPTEELSMEDLPDWLEDFDSDEESPIPKETDKSAHLIEEYTWQPVEEQEDETPQEKLDINTASLIQMERLPNMGFSRAQIIFSHREEHGPFKDLEELLELPGITPETLESIKELVEIKSTPEPEAPPATEFVKQAKPTKPVTGPLPDTPIEDAEDEFHAKQIKARNMISQGDLTEALVTYETLIKRGKRLEKIIDDLLTISADHPRNADVLQALGDAYMRDDQLQEALDTYSKAETLLQ